MLLDGFTVPGSMLAPWAVRRKHEMTTRTSLENMGIFGYFSGMLLDFHGIF